jgi:hypothetical protein
MGKHYFRCIFTSLARIQKKKTDLNGPFKGGSESLIFFVFDEANTFYFSIAVQMLIFV